MSIPNYVQPGNLITANFMNSLIDEMKALDARLTALGQLVPGSQGELVITDISPAMPHTGDEIFISGVNFGLLQQQTVVTFNGANPVRDFKTPPSNDRLLVLNVPQFSFQGDTLPVDVGVSNGRGGFDHRQITVVKPVATIPVATLVVSQNAWPTTPNNLIPETGGTFVFPFKVELLAANMDETYDVEVVLPSGWSWDLTSDALGQKVVPKQVFLQRPQAGGPAPNQMLFIKATIPATTKGTTANLTVAVRAKRNASTFGTTSISFDIGLPFPGLGTITFVLPPTVSGPGATIKGTSGVAFQVPTPIGTAGQLTILARSLKKGDYNIALTWKNTASNGWVATLGGDPTNPQMTLDFTMAQEGDAPTSVVLVAAAGATAAKLAITITAKSPVTDFGSVTLDVQPA